jgi:putative tricarboxylic transport membrane protein
MEFMLEARRGEALVAGALTVLSGYAIWVGWGMPAGTVALPGPGFFPVLLAALLAGTGVALVVRVALRPGRDESGVRLGHGHVVVTLLALAGTFLFFERAGFVISMSVLLLVLFRTFAGLAWLRAAVAAVAAAGLAHLLFDSLFGVSLPGGWR